MRRLAIAVDASRGYEPWPTGTETYARHVIDGLVREGGHDYRLYTRGAPSQWLDRLEQQGATIDPLGDGRLWTQLRLARALRRRPADVLFVPAHVLPFVLATPGVVTVHDVGHRHVPEAHTFAQRAYLEVTARYHARRAAALIADSASTAADLVRFFGARPERVHVVHLGGWQPGTRPSPESIAAFRRRIELRPSAEVIVHVGTRQPRKNLARLIRALPGILRERPDAMLLLAGRQGWGNEDLGAVAREAGVQSRVKILDYVDLDELHLLYFVADLVAIPSLHEGFGLTMQEAMTCGAPVAAANASSLPEVGGDAVAWFDPLDVADIARVIVRVLGDAAERRRLSAAGVARAATFTWARCAAETQCVLELAARPEATARSSRSNGQRDQHA
ncbi:MAG: glycosyltransferase family 1 protein [Ardenticatenales bacterium]